MAANKRTSDQDAGYVNKTGTELEILQRMEKAYRRSVDINQKRNTDASLKWFRNYIVKNVKVTNDKAMFRDEKLQRNRPMIGKMYFYRYDPKHKATLPIYDEYPLVFFFNAVKKDVTILYGINLHYLAPAMRITAFKALLTLRTEKRYRQSTKLNIEWSMLKAMAQSKLFEHAVHAYRMDHVLTNFVEIPSQSWEIVLNLPLAKWHKGTKKDAWKLK